MTQSHRKTRPRRKPEPAGGFFAQGKLYALAAALCLFLPASRIWADDLVLADLDQHPHPACRDLALRSLQESDAEQTFRLVTSESEHQAENMLKAGDVSLLCLPVSLGRDFHFLPVAFDLPSFPPPEGTDMLSPGAEERQKTGDFRFSIPGRSFQLRKPDMPGAATDSASLLPRAEKPQFGSASSENTEAPELTLPGRSAIVWRFYLSRGQEQLADRLAQGLSRLSESGNLLPEKNRTPRLLEPPYGGQHPILVRP